MNICDELHHMLNNRRRLSISLGKKRVNDIVTRICPRSTANDILTNRISRKHCVLELKDGQLWISDPGSPNGTVFAGSKIEQDGVKYKRQGKELELGGALAFRVDCVTNVQKVDWRQYMPLMNPEAEPLWDNAFNPHLNAIRLRRFNNLGQDDSHGKEGYVLVYRVATLGASPDCALCFEDKGLEPVHAGFVYMNGRFYLENLTELTDVFVNEVMMSKNELMPLSFGDQILIARVRLQFEQRYQLFVNL